MRFTLLLLILLCARLSYTQKINPPLISENFNQIDLTEVLTSIEKKHDITFYYEPSWLTSIKITEQVNGEPLDEFLNKILSAYSLYFIQYSPTKYIILRNKNLLRPYQSDKVYTSVGDTSQIITGQVVLLKGKVLSDKTGESIPGARVFAENMEKGSVTDENGNYVLELPTGYHTLSYQFTGLETKEVLIKLFGSALLNISLQEQPLRLDEFVVQGQGSSDAQSINSGRTQINIEELKKRPASIGEVDLIKNLSMLPGVKTVGEASSGFNVRGGSVDQNLILLDGATVYNSSHLLGFYSIFNADAMLNANLYRGGIPAYYGGRTSSVLNIQQKEGSYESFNGNAGIGLIASRLSINGPIIKDKASLIISGRTTYSNFILRSINDPDIQKSRAAFYDLSAKVGVKIGTKSKLNVSTYYSYDDFKFANDTSFSWNNLLNSVQLFTSFSTNTLSTLTASSSRYQYSLKDETPVIGNTISYQIQTEDLTYSISHNWEQGEFISGFQATLHRMQPGMLRNLDSDSPLLEKTLLNENAGEIAFHIGQEWKLSNAISLYSGLRYSHYLKFGKGVDYVFSPDQHKNELSISDTINYSASDIHYNQGGLEPRLSIKYAINSLQSIKIGYNRLRQNIHLISNTVSPQPIDVWRLSNQHIKPQTSDLISIGYFKESPLKTYKLSAEIYYKWMNNVVEYKDGASLLVNPLLDADLLQGKGKAYGLELLAERNKGRLTGWASYTYSRAFFLVSGSFPQEVINKGEYYPTNYDQPHNLNINLNYAISRRLSFTANFIYATGRPVTGPTDFYYINLPIFEYEKRNQYRIPDYHRLDMALNIEGNHKKNKKWKGSWSLSLYNAYGRKNAYSVYFVPEANTIDTFKYSVIAIPVPSITYNLSFNP